MPIKMDGKFIDDVKVGNQQIDRIYAGSDLVWANVAPTEYTKDYINWSTKSGSIRWLGMVDKFEPFPGRSVKPIEFIAQKGCGDCRYEIYATDDESVYNASPTDLSKWTTIAIGPYGSGWTIDMSNMEKHRFWLVKNTAEGFTRWEEPPGIYYYEALRFTFKYYGKKANK